MKAVAAAAVLLVLLHGASAMSWESCSEGKAAILNVTLTPDPATAGTPVELVIAGVAEMDAPGGLLDITVSYRGFDIYTESKDLCEKTKCPVKKGPMTIDYTQYLPPIVPPGPYTLHLQASGANNTDLLCLVVDFQINSPMKKVSMKEKIQSLMHHS